MVIIAGLLRQDRVTLWQGQPIAQVSVINVVLYFILGLGLFSQTNFLALRAAWGYEHAKIHQHIRFSLGVLQSCICPWVGCVGVDPANTVLVGFPGYTDVFFRFLADNH